MCHWITVSTIGCQPGEINVYDTLYADVDVTTKHKIERVFGSSVIYKLPNIQKQEGIKDCGLFAIAIATDIAFGNTSSVFQFQQSKLRPHMKECFEKQCISRFPYNYTCTHQY